MKKKRIFIFILVMITVIALSPACFAAAPAEGFDPADGKYIKAEPERYWEGRYSDGRVFAEYMAKELTGDFDNLVNYAVGGAFSGILTGSTADGTDRSNWSSWLKGWGGIEQTERFVADMNGKADPGALYIISTGGNDSYAVDTLGLDATTRQSAANIVMMIDNLVKAGATDIVVMLQSTAPGKTESEFTKLHRAATQEAVDDYISTHKDCNIVIVDTDPLFTDMEMQGKEAYGLKTWGFYQISDWVPAYGYALASEDNSKLLPTNKAEDIYGYGYYYSTDSAYYTPEAVDFNVDEFLYYDEYHFASKTQMHKASYILNTDLTTDSGTFRKVYDSEPSAFAVSPMAEKTYSMVYTFGDSMIDSGRALAVTSELVNGREKQSVSIRDMIDTRSDEWYSTYVNYVLQTGIMKGAGANTFAPGESVTRAQFVTILGRAAGVEDASEANPVKTNFSDVDAAKYYASHVAWAIENGIANGTGNDLFSPDAKISRQDMAKMIGAYADARGIQLPEADGTDGIPPEEATSRAAAASVVAKLLNY